MPLVDLITGMDFGVGTDLGGQLFGDAVIRTEAQKIPNTGGQTEDIFLTLVESQEEQDSALKLSTEISASYGLFGGSGKFDLSQEMHVHEFAISLVIRSTVFNSFHQMRDVQFGTEASTQLKNGQEDRFRQQFGDLFVRGVRTGGELVAILQIEGHDASDQSTVKADLEASGILGAVSASTSDSFSSHVSKATTGRKVKLRHFQVGGNQIASIDAGTMVQHALTFAEEVRDAGNVKEGENEGPQSEAFQALLISYETIDTPLPPNFIDLESAKETIGILMQMRRDALTRMTAFNFVVAHPEQFDIPAGMKVNAIVGRFETAVASLTSAASRCVDRPKESTDALKSVAGLDVPVEELPPRRPAAVGKPVPPPLTIVVPTLVGLDLITIMDAIETGFDPQQEVPLIKELNEFFSAVNSGGFGDPNVILEPPEVNSEPQGQDVRLCIAQHPGPGDLVARGDQVILRFGPVAVPVVEG